MCVIARSAGPEAPASTVLTPYFCPARVLKRAPSLYQAAGAAFATPKWRKTDGNVAPWLARKVSIAWVEYSRPLIVPRWAFASTQISRTNAGFGAVGAGCTPGELKYSARKRKNIQEPYWFSPPSSHWSIGFEGVV